MTNLVAREFCITHVSTGRTRPCIRNLHPGQRASSSRLGSSSATELTWARRQVPPHSVVLFYFEQETNVVGGNRQGQYRLPPTRGLRRRTTDGLEQRLEVDIRTRGGR